MNFPMTTHYNTKMAELHKVVVGSKNHTKMSSKLQAITDKYAWMIKLHFPLSSSLSAIFALYVIQLQLVMR